MTSWRISPAKRVFTRLSGALPGRNPGKPDFGLDPGDGPLGFLLDFRGGNRDLEGMLAAFD